MLLVESQRGIPLLISLTSADFISSNYTIQHNLTVLEFTRQPITIVDCIAHFR